MTTREGFSAELRDWLHSLGLTDVMIRKYGLDQPMSELAWNARVKDVIRYTSTMRRENVKRKPKPTPDPTTGPKPDPKP